MKNMPWKTHIRNFFFLILFLVASSCLESEEEKKAKEFVRKTYPLLGLNVPESLVKEVRYFKGYCKENSNDLSFTFSDVINSVRYSYDDKTKEVSERFSLNVWWMEEFGWDRYDRTLPPNSCRPTYKVPNLDNINITEGNAVCIRTITGEDDNGDEIRIRKKEPAKCLFEITRRTNCLPGEQTKIDPSKPDKRPTWMKTRDSFRDNQKCSSPNRESFKTQTRAKWKYLKEKYGEKE